MIFKSEMRLKSSMNRAILLTAAMVVVCLAPTQSWGVSFVEESAKVATTDGTPYGVTPPMGFEVPLAPGFNLIALGGGGGGMIQDITQGLRSRGTLIRVVGFETPLINPNGFSGVGGKLYDPAVPGFVNSLEYTDDRLGYWFKMSAADVLNASGGTAKVVAHSEDPFTDGALSPVYDFLGLYGRLTVDDEPAQLGTQIEVVDGGGNLAGRFEVREEGYYGFIPLYRDDPSSAVDEGADTGEWLSIVVDGQATGQHVQWTSFGDAIRVDVGSTSVPSDFRLQANYPNPFNPGTTIPYRIAEEAHVSLRIWNTSGQLTRELVASTQSAGHYTATWDGRDNAGHAVANGVYFAKLIAGDYQATQKMVLAE